MRDFLWTLGTSTLPNGSPITVPGVAPADVQNYWNTAGLLTGAPGARRCTSSPSQYFADQFGSHSRRNPMLLCERNLNQMKGRVFDLQLPRGRPTNPIDLDRFNALANDALWSNQAQNELFDLLRQVIGVFNYINHPQALPILQANRNRLQTAAVEIAGRVRALENLGLVFEEFFPAWYQETATRTRVWLANRLEELGNRFDQAEQAGQNPLNAAYVRQTLLTFFDALSQIRSPF